jgi:hypothetical protein
MTEITYDADMARKKTTFYVDESLLRSLRVLAARQGTRDSDVVEAALREYLGFAVLDRVRARSDLTEEEAMKLAYDELHAMRRGE